MDRKITLVLILSFVAIFVEGARAEESSSSSSSAQSAQTSLIEPTALAASKLYDHNGDGQVIVMAFGDSMTRGTGDFISSNEEVETVEHVETEAGYPLRIENTIAISTLNQGDPGERFIAGGLERFVSTVQAVRPDVVIILEGANDAIDQENSADYFRALQTAINVAISIGTEPILLTLPPAIANHEGLNTYMNAYNDKIRPLGVYNGLLVSDVYQAFVNTCAGLADCALINRPEGLHPNKAGYDVIGEMAIAALLNLDILTNEGRVLYGNALYIDPASIKTVPGL